MPDDVSDPMKSIKEDSDTLCDKGKIVSRSSKNDAKINAAEDEDENEESYRMRVYGTLGRHEKTNAVTIQKARRIDPSSRFLKRVSERFSQELTRRSSSFVEALPETPTGWAVLTVTMASLCLSYEINLQKSLTAPPTVYCQLADEVMKKIYQRLTVNPDSIFSRNIHPSLFVGTRSVVSSTAAFLGGGPCSEGYTRFREVVAMSQDGAQIALDWELPVSDTPDLKKEALHGPFRKNLVLILHGINNDTSFGYMRSLMRACTKRGWAAVGMNFRGCGGISLSTPRGYNGAYTGDLRCVIRTLGSRLAPGFSIFLVGNSLGANIMTKYLGEEGRGGTLPMCVAGGITLGNPVSIHSKNITFPWGHILGLGARKGLVQHLRTFRKMKSAYFQKRFRMALLASTIGEFDEALAPIFVKNDTYPPYQYQIGYKDGESYWHDASSYRYIRHISVPLLQLSSKDDFLIASSLASKLYYSVSNPNVMVVHTRCGGHLGWHESPPDTDNIFGFGTSWGDTATTHFIDAVLKGKLEIAKAKVGNATSESTARKQPANLKSKL
eukprot:CAMPEP_0194209518 /NCGR_PEP_ID=MMETSP0156-20130528/7615_1 /TAXON_ID=33649 /ORGANISM="Thalassionema nitzschioides, Strain L26-B" /LENGTH=552 /DNA_ID=CAMNT_0038936705 /DNA_START=109 /DNA_END=1767 /DNA_ORIENTATION=+